MNKNLKRAIGTLALSAASLALTSPSFAATYSAIIGPSNSTFFSDGAVAGQLFTGIRSTRIITTTLSFNIYDAATGTNCTGQPTHIEGAITYTGNQSAAAEYFCPGNSNLVISQGGLHDW